jgi:hypothetical protein
MVTVLLAGKNQMAGCRRMKVGRGGVQTVTIQPTWVASRTGCKKSAPLIIEILGVDHALLELLHGTAHRCLTAGEKRAKRNTTGDLRIMAAEVTASEIADTTEVCRPHWNKVHVETGVRYTSAASSRTDIGQDLRVATSVLWEAMQRLGQNMTASLNKKMAEEGSIGGETDMTYVRRRQGMIDLSSVTRLVVRLKMMLISF